jgi:hypothetical protein
MDMKIEHPRANSREAVVRTDNVTGGVSRPSAKGVEARDAADAVRLSGDLHLATRAFQAATAEDDRTQVVDQARALFESGELGVDVDELADRMVDALLHSHDSDS